jgi:hypothetical protein
LIRGNPTPEKFIRYNDKEEEEEEVDKREIPR